MRLITLALFFAACAFAQFATYGTIGAASSGYWENPSLAYGAGASYAHNRITVGAEAWRAEVSRHRDPWLNNDRRTEALLGLVSYRVWRNLHAEAGGGIQRITDTAYGPLIEGSFRYQRGVVTVGGYYQIGKRIFARMGYRRLMLHNDHDTNQIYSSVGMTW